MMSKKTFSRLSAAILLLLTVSIPVGAQEISVEAARQTAAKFINEHAAKLPAKSRKGMMKAPPKAESLQLVYTQEDQLHESPALYVFEQPKQGGFIIASADERVVPIFGYFEEGNFQDAVKESCCFKTVLENFGQQIAYARENGLPQITSTLNDDNDFSPIEPITRDGVSWHQSSVCEYFGWDDCISFNKYCPIDKNTGERCVTGCTANTMGILMYHHQWPERGVGSHSYQWRDTTLTANFGETTYQYELMGPDESLETALLLYHCGVAVDMNYSSNGSGGYIHRNNAMESFFRYNYVKKITGGDYTKVSEIHDALSHNNPLYADNSDHAFLIDGYQPGGFIHLNLHSGFLNGYVHISGLKNDYGGGRVLSGFTAPSFSIGLFVPEKDVTTITITKDEMEYEILFNKATITKGTGTGDFVIPSTVNDENGVTYPVTSIGESAFRNCSNLTSIEIPNSVTSIGGSAFSGCSGLTSVTIPNSVTSIGGSAFSGCSGLTSVTIPNSVTAIGSWVFYETGIYNNSADGVFYVDKWACGYKGTMPANTNLVIREGTLGIADNAFSNCSGLTSITIPNSVTSIGQYAFLGCSGLTGVTIPNSVTSIGSSAFSRCTGLTSVTFHCKEIGPWFQGITTIKEIILGEEVTSIGANAFSRCSGLTSITIPNSVTEIGESAFYNCSGLKKVIVKDIAAWCGIEFDFANNPLEYAQHLYSDENTEITDLVIPDGVTSIGKRAFYGCEGLTSVTIPNSVTSIESGAFSGCSGLTSVTIPNSVTSIESGAFSGCTGLTSVTIPNSVTSIESGAFSGCSGLTSVTIGNSVTTIGTYAFDGCTGLTSVTIGNSVKSIGERAFEDCTGLQKVIVKDIAAWCGIEFNYNDNPLQYAKHLYSDENTEITDLIIPNGVTRIGAYAFVDCSGLTSVTIPNSVKSIGRQAFYNYNYEEQGLTSVVSDIVFPFYLDYAVFPHNKSATLYVPGGTLNLYKSYGWGDYFKEIVEREDNKAETITQEGITYVVYRGEAQVVGVSGNPEDVVIPASISNEKGERFSVINIAPNAFSNLYKVTSITIPNTVTTIAGDLFSNYSLTTINVEEGNPAYSSIDGVLFNKDQTELIRCPRGKQGAYVIPNTVKRIGDNAFRNCYLTNVTIPNSVESIGWETFYNCSGLTSVTLPSSLTSMGYRAFGYCRNLTSVISHIERPFDDTWFFTGINTQAILYVPVGTIEKYRALDSWNNAFKEIVEFDINGIEGVTVSNSNSSDSENAPMYNLSGQRVGKNYKGIVIKNGKKMIVK